MFEVGDNVISEDKSSINKIGVIWKITKYAVHVKFDDGESCITFQKFFFNPIHHMQSNVSCLKIK